jgi:hypothetical protein
MLLHIDCDIVESKELEFNKTQNDWWVLKLRVPFRGSFLYAGKFGNAKQSSDSRT